MGFWIIIPAEGAPERREMERPPELTEAHELIGNGCSLVELVCTGKIDGQHDFQMFVDEEGLLKGQPIVNVIATELAISTLARKGLTLNGVIVGTALLLVGDDCKWD